VTRDRNTEDALVKRPAVELLGELGWETVDAYGEFGRPGADGRSGLGRETEAEVVLTSRLRPALFHLNPEASEEAVDAAVAELVRDRSAMSPAAANREVYRVLKDGVRVAVPAADDGSEEVERIRVIDWNEPANKELDGQICRQFASSGVVRKKEAQAANSRELRRLPREDHRYVFTLIHKFRTDAPGEAHPVLSERDDIVVITDEAHRSQYAALALNMRQALPNAAFLAFTGTPLIQGEEERTRDVFGDYVSVYDFRQSVEDRATVPLFYENRVPELQLSNRDLNEDMERLLEEAELDEVQEEKLDREFAREYHLITREDRLDAVAEDLVRHFPERGFRGKAMVISIDKATAVRMYDKVGVHWKRRIEGLRAERFVLPKEDFEAIAEIDDRIAWMEETDMAVVVSPAQNEIADMKAKGLDFRRHRRRMVEEDLETKFKDADDPFRLVFVCHVDDRL